MATKILPQILYLIIKCRYKVTYYTFTLYRYYRKWKIMYVFYDISASNNNQVLNMSQAVKHEQIYANRRLFSQSEMMTTQDLSNAYPSASYDHSAPPTDVQVPTNLYTGKPTRIQYSAPQKIMPQPDATYAKYNSGIQYSYFIFVMSKCPHEMVHHLSLPTQQYVYGRTASVRTLLR